MKINKNKQKIKLVRELLIGYNRNTNIKDGDKMAEFIQKLNNLKLPPQQLKELGLDKDWQKKISPKFVERVFKTAEKYRAVLKELSKN